MVCLIVTIQAYPPINGTLPLSISLNALSLFILFSLNNLCDPPIASIIDPCVYCASNSSLVIHLIVDVYEYPPPIGKVALLNPFLKSLTSSLLTLFHILLRHPFWDNDHNLSCWLVP